MVVIHCTELPDLATAREYGERVLCDSGAGNSGHFYIDRDGSVVQYVAPERVAHHVRGMNAHTLGIELVNTGRYPDWFDSRHQAMDEAYTEHSCRRWNSCCWRWWRTTRRCDGLPGMTSWTWNGCRPATMRR